MWTLSISEISFRGTPRMHFLLYKRTVQYSTALHRVALYLLEVNVPFLKWPSPTKKSIVAYLLKVRTVKPGKQPLLGNGCVTCKNGVTVGSVFSTGSVLRLYRVGNWCDMADILREREHGNRGMSSGEDTANWEDLVRAVVNCRVRVLAITHKVTYSYDL
jgi:hypothetical protein